MTERSFAPHGEAPEDEVSQRNEDAKRKSDDANLAKREERNEARRAKREAKVVTNQAKRFARAAKRNARKDARRAKLAEILDAPSVRVMRAIFALVTANAGTQFAIQAWMSYRFAKDVWGIPQPLCIAIIFALDLFAVTFMAFTYLLRTASWTTQLYVWLVFVSGVAAQLFAAELYGADQKWEAAVRVFAALPALFLAASLHGLIIWRNHATPRPARQVEGSPAQQPATPAKPQVNPDTALPATPETPTATLLQRRPQPPAPSRIRTQVAARGVDPAVRAEAVRRVIDGRESAAKVAQEIGQQPRNVQNWVKAAREQTPATNGHTVAETLKVQVN